MDHDLPALLANAPFLRDVPDVDRQALFYAQAERVHIPARGFICRQGDPLEDIYIVALGTVLIWRRVPDPDGVQVTVVEREMGPGYILDRFGLVYAQQGQQVYTASAQAITDVVAWRVKPTVFESLFLHYPQARQAFVPLEIIRRLRTIPYTGPIDLITLSYLAEQVTVHALERDAILYRPEDRADWLYLIHRGQVHLRRPQGAAPEDNLWLGTGNVFGFPGLLRGGQPRSKYDHLAQITTSSEIYQVPWEAIQHLSEAWDHLRDAKIQRRVWDAVQAHTGKVFERYDPKDIRKLAGFCSYAYIPQPHLLLLQGDLADSMWILMEGQAMLSGLDPDTNQARPRTPVQAPLLFSEEALVATVNVPWTVEAEAGSHWVRLHWQDFQRFLQLEGARADELRRALQIPPRLGGQQDLVQQQQDYPWLMEGEILVTLQRRHWVEILAKLRVAGFLFIPAVLLATAAFVLTWNPGAALVVAGAMLSPGILWGVMDYLNDFLVVTNQRVIQQEKVVFITEFRRGALLEQVEQIDVRQGFWGRVLGYGTLLIQTAGTAGAIRFDRAPDPEKLKATVFRWRARRLARFRAEQRAEIQTELEKRLDRVLILPSRVRAYSVPQRGPQTMTRPLWRRIWDYLTIESQLRDWEALDHVIWRKHWFVLVREILVPVLVALGILGLLALEAGAQGLGQFLGGATQVLLGAELVTGLLFLVIMGWITYRVIDWWNDTYELTRDRIIDVEQLPFGLRSHRREAQFSQIQDVSVRIPSPLQMILNYGDVVVETAATEGSFTFDHVPHPREVADEITRRIVEWRRQEELRRTRERTRELPDWFEIYSRLQQA